MDYTPETLRQIQRIQLGMLAAVDRICRENGLTYYLYHGTLLGAIRHNGFIPWDDDVDIAMPRPDYDRFLETAAGLLPAGYRLRHYTCTENYPHSYAKIDDTATTMVESSTNFVGGFYLDVFPLDGADHTLDFSARLRRRLLALYRNFFLLYFAGEDRAFKHGWLIRLGKKILHRTVNIKRWQRRYERLCKKQPYESSREISFLFNHPMQAYDRQWFGSPVGHPFEGHLFYIPEQSEALMADRYGPDYMTLPEEDQRRSFHMERCRYYALDESADAYIAGVTDRAPMKNPLRVLHIVSSLGRRSGRAAVIMNYYRALDRSKVQFDFLYFAKVDYSYEDEIAALGGKLYFLPYPSEHPLRFERRWLKRFFLRHDTYFAIHYHVLSPGLLSLKHARNVGIPLRIMHGHSSRFATGALKSLRNRLLCGMMRRSTNARLACSAAAARLLFGRQWRQKATILPNAIPAERYAFDPHARAKLRREMGLGETLVLGTVGRFSPEKNQGFLLDVLACLKGRQVDCRLVFVGDSVSLGAAFQERVRRMGLERDVLFLLDRDDVGSLLSMMDIFMLPSLYEGLPLSLVEAQASGLPCLVSDRVTEEAVLTGLVRRLPLEKGPESWADAIQNTALPTPSERGAAAIPDEYDASKAAPVLAGYYLEVLADNQSG